MQKIWAKTLIEKKITANIVYSSETDFEIDNFEDSIKSICDLMDVPAPIIMPKHIRDYIIFNCTTFTKDDFIEKIYFEKLVISNVKFC